MLNFDPEQVLREAPLHYSFASLSRAVGKNPTMLRYYCSRAKILKEVDRMIGENKNESSKKKKQNILITNGKNAGACDVV